MYVRVLNDDIRWDNNKNKFIISNKRSDRQMQIQNKQLLIINKLESPRLGSHRPL